MSVKGERLPSDQELIRRIRAGDRQAFDEAAAAHGPAVGRHLSGIVHDAAAAEDLLQEVLLRLWTRAEQYDGRGTLEAWLLRIATNLAINHLRSARRRRERPGAGPYGGEDVDAESGWPEGVADPSAAAPSEAAEQAERREVLGRLVEALPPAKREVVRLAREEEMELADVAEELGIPIGTVKSRLHHAQRELRRLWDEAYGK